MCAGNEQRGLPELALRRGQRGARRVEHDGEDAVGPLAEVVLEDLPGRVGLGAGHGEHVRQVLRQRDGRKCARDEHGEPGEQHGDAKAEDGSGPALGHWVRVARNPDQ